MKITPQDFIDMNKEFEEEGTPFSLLIPTQDEIDEKLLLKKQDDAFGYDTSGKQPGWMFRWWRDST